ncbi:uncharacterized protein LOC101852886 [Aplysia californica]|uniref:Uncharacterized protein LOC101852886 n=1 Tax=Aplysia californica TaxID=6500 RepID=A0ABM0K7H7_APLCA|nr:uncharacterized protein LOC101852886 [Aplysia californica]
MIARKRESAGTMLKQTSNLSSLLIASRVFSSALLYTIIASTNLVSRLIFQPNDTQILGFFTAILSSLIVLETILFKSYDASEIMMRASAGLPFSPLTPSSINLMMQNPINLFVYVSSVEESVTATHIKKNYSDSDVPATIFLVGTWVCTVAFGSSENLVHRKIGVPFFHVGLWLVTFLRSRYSANEGKDYDFESFPSLDTFGWVVLLFSIILPLVRLEREESDNILPISDRPFPQRLWRRINTPFVQVLLRLASLVVMVAVSTWCWQTAKQEIASVCETPVPDFHLQVRILDECERPQLMLLLLLWRWCGPQALLQFLLLAVFLNRLKTFVNLAPPITIFVSPALYFFSHNFSMQVMESVF